MADPGWPIDFEALRYEPLGGRSSKVGLGNLGQPSRATGSIRDWLIGLPDAPGVRSLRDLGDAIVEARSAGRPVLVALGGHVIKTGCGPFLVDWIDQEAITGVAMNGSAAIHDLELAVAGRTSEDVGPSLEAGSFGFARETSDLFVEACRRAAETGNGLGRALGEVVLDAGGPGLDSSLLVAAVRRGVPATVHVAVGTDIVHMTPRLDGSALGRATLDDFRTLCGLVAGLQGGVWMNLGSAVVLPEVFLKAVAVAKNLGYSLDRMTTANLDLTQQYRATWNVLARPGGRGIALVGHHEILIPLLHLLVDSGRGRGASPRPPSEDPDESTARS